MITSEQHITASIILFENTNFLTSKEKIQLPSETRTFPLATPDMDIVRDILLAVLPDSKKEGPYVAKKNGEVFQIQ